MILVFFLAVAPSFRNIDNAGTVLYNASTIGIMAVPIALLMIGGEFDLSAGVLVTTSGLAAAQVAWWFNFNVWVGVGLALVVALLVGLANGVLLTRTRLPSFLTTLAMFFVLQGVNLGVTRWVAGGVTSPTISDMAGFRSAHAVFAPEWTLSAGSHTLHLKVTILFWILLTAAGAWALLRTRQGNWVFAVGGEAAAARASGVPVRRTKVALYLGVGFSAWLAGMHSLFAYSVVQSGDGVGNEFIYIIAAVIGGCLLTGGSGSVVGSRPGRPHLRHDPARHQLRRVEPGLVQGVPRGDAAGFDTGQRVAQAEGGTAVSGTGGTQGERGPVQPLLRFRQVGKSYGNVDALRGVDLVARQGEVTCVLGDNGAGKSTLIKIISGLHRHTAGEMFVDGTVTSFDSPRDAQDAGIATVYQDLALAPLMSVWRNFFLGHELTRRSVRAA